MVALVTNTASDLLPTRGFGDFYLDFQNGVYDAAGAVVFPLPLTGKLHLEAYVGAYIAPTGTLSDQWIEVHVGFADPLKRALLYRGAGPLGFDATIAFPDGTTGISLYVNCWAQAGTSPAVASPMWYSVNYASQEGVSQELHPEHEEDLGPAASMDDARFIDHYVMKKLAALGLIDKDDGKDDDDDGEDWKADDHDGFPFASKDHEDEDVAPPAEQGTAAPAPPATTPPVSSPPVAPSPQVKEEPKA